VRCLYAVLIACEALLWSAGAIAGNPDQLDQARVADMYQTQAGQPAKDQPPAAKVEPEQELNTLTGEIDRDSDRLMKMLSGVVEPWMWWVAAAVWVVLVLLAGRLISYAVSRLFPTSGISWLGRAFRLLCYLVCGLVALYFVLHGFGATLLAAPVLLVESKLLLLAAAFGVADLALMLVNVAIYRYMTDHAGQPIERSPRVLTLLPLMRNIVMVTLGVVLALMVLGQLGVNIAPLLAGAGVVGVAVGFGAQKLVQDVITGAFMLFENTLAIGETVKIGDHTGTVEGMTIRTLRIRDGSGQLHTLPFSSVTTVINMSRDYGFYPIELNISYESSIERAMEVITRTVTEMQEDPALKPYILAPVEIYGVDRLSEWAMVLTGGIKTPPLQQAVVARAFNRRIKEAFDQAGIKFGHPTTMVNLVRRKE